MPLGIYISVPFCRTKCSFCNFASGVFSKDLFDRYLNVVSEDIARAGESTPDANFEEAVDSIYLGGGTPSVLAPDQLMRLFGSIQARFRIIPTAEITVECAPGTLSPELIQSLKDCAVNRVSLGVQSFVDEESRSVGRLHTREVTLRDIDALRRAGIPNTSVDLIAGLPHQTAESWQYSLEQVVATGVPHVSVYMLEVDEDSRLGRELLAGGTRYHAHFVPDEDLTADFYQQACGTLNAAGIAQYEISNFARPERESTHNLKYWLRKPYVGFGVDAHSMLPVSGGEALRFFTPDDLDRFLIGDEQRSVRRVTRAAAEDEAFFLGLRLNRGMDLRQIAMEFGKQAFAKREAAVGDLEKAGLLVHEQETLRLTDRGRLLSNEVFERLILAEEPGAEPAPRSSSFVVLQ